MSNLSEINTINTLLENVTPRKLHGILKNEYNHIYLKINEMKTTGGFTEKLYMFINEMEEVPKCKQCLKNELDFHCWKTGFREFCSVSCQATYSHTKIPPSVQEYNKKHNTNLTNVSQLPEVIKKRNKTMIDRFGSTMPMNDNEIVKAKKEATSMKRYGVKNAAHAPSVRKKAQNTMRNRTAEEKKASQEKFKDTCKEKFGASNPMKNKEIFNKAKETRLERYGVEHCLQNTELAKEVNKKARTTMQEKYGSPNQMDAPGAKEKCKRTHLEKYGVEHPMKNKEVQEKVFSAAQLTLKEKYNVTNWMQVPGAMDNRKLTCLEKYGVEFLFEDPKRHEQMRIKARQTMLLKYGYEYNMQVPEFFEAAQKSAFKRKEYKWKTGEISLVQGYEPIVLKELEEQGYKFNEVLISPKDMPKIMYWLDEKEHRYFPDIFIPKENIIIEVKSDYTLKAEWDKNQAKFEATKSLGFDFRLEVR